MKPKTLYLERLLQINTATLVALGALLLGMGQRDEKLPLLMLVAAIASVALTDVLGYVRLNRAVANLAVLAGVAVFASSTAIYRADVRVLLPSVGVFLSFWLIILLLQKKDGRAYRHLIMLSLLQVVVASVFSHGVWFGLLLVVYMTVGFSALALLLLQSQWTRYRSLEKRQSGALVSRQRRAEVFVGMPGDRGQMGIGRELLVRLGKMAVGTLLLTAVLFFTLPRFSRSAAWRGATVQTRHVVGFSDKVALGEIGEIIESREEVMRVRLADAKTGLPYQHHGSLYLRGVVLNRYSRSEWKYERTTNESVVPLAEGEATVRQAITIEPLDKDRLFCVWPFGLLDVRPKDEVVIDQRAERLGRPARFHEQRFTYELGTTALSGGVQVELIPCRRPLEPDDLEQLLQLPGGSCEQALRQTWRNEELPADSDPLRLARALTARFHSPQRFQYSLERQSRQSDVDQDVDPIIDFLQNNPQGHCEYFASALTLLLRSRNVPARFVVGYNCDEFNNAGGFWQVRQWHAHAWVEAYLGRSEIPEEQIAKDGAELWQHGGWLRLEPTPGMTGPAATRNSSFFEPVKSGWQRLQDFWSDYVVEMDRRRQQRAIYGPIVAAIKNAFHCLCDPDWWRNLMWKTLDALNVAQGGLHWLWAGIALVVGLPVTVYVGRRVGWLLQWFWWRVIRRARPPNRGVSACVEFYRRLEALLARHGITRHTGQTQHEFAAAAGAQIAETTGQQRLARLPVAVAEAFYQVRFGRLPLDSDQARAVEDALDELTACGEEG
ncbi:MAG: DUF3488 domain-containing protein [Candidatus Nealsonbacteria bacterium]|nr:DUF3488 domain-containing protein [Candidatus Nealsonbacteria bacterium]